jgi:hypothetical protein
MPSAIMKRVLFVGEDQPLWQEIRNQPASFSGQWSAEFAHTSQRRSPGPSRATLMLWLPTSNYLTCVAWILLDEILRRQPRALRIVLSEQGDLESTLKCIGKAHHHLLKPCDLGQILTTLNQGFTLETWLPSQTVQALIGKMRWIPSPPNLYFQIAIEMESPAASG